MARLDNKMLFFTTSPRSPEKMVPEIKLLHENFEGYAWNKTTQINFMRKLSESGFFQGSGSADYTDFSARDRINRGPKALGFVDITPNVYLTEAGTEFVYGKRPQEIFLRQLLKFQIPSPFHKENYSISGTFYIKPYLEIFRLLYDLEYLTFDEVKIFILQLTDYRKYETIKNKIILFRKEKEKHKGEYKKFVDEVWTNAVYEIFRDRIVGGQTRTRETQDASINKFITTQKSNMRDYTDACFRYLRYTGLVSLARESRTIRIFDEKRVEVKFFLNNVKRYPEFIDDEVHYKSYLYTNDKPVLYTDNREHLINLIMGMSTLPRSLLETYDIITLKDMRDELLDARRRNIIADQVRQIKEYSQYQDISNTFAQVTQRGYYDAPLMFEYNTWRAMTMLDGGNIKGNFKFDDEGQPLSTAAGNMPDIECYYDDYAMSVEVTLQAGQRQYETEGEPVARHYGQLKARTGKDTYCLFIAPIINPATYAHFYGLNKISISLYGGKSKIIPLTLEQFRELVNHSYKYSQEPKPNEVRAFLDNAISSCEHSPDENIWKSRIQECVDSWLV